MTQLKDLFFYNKFLHCDNKNITIRKIRAFGKLLQIYHNRKSKTIRIYYNQI